MICKEWLNLNLLRRRRCAPVQALLLEAVDRSTGLEVGSRRHISAGTDSYYEYLLKYWLLRGKRDDHWRSRWEQAVDEILQSLILHPEGWPLSLVADLDVTSGTLSRSLHHLRCFFPGNLALGVMAGAVVGQKAKLYMELASNMTHACFQLYNQTATGTRPRCCWPDKARRTTEWQANVVQGLALSRSPFGRMAAFESMHLNTCNVQR